MSDLIEEFARDYCKGAKEALKEYKKHPNPLFKHGAYHVSKWSLEAICNDIEKEIEKAPDGRKQVTFSKGVHRLDRTLYKEMKKHLPLKYRSFSLSSENLKKYS